MPTLNAEQIKDLVEGTLEKFGRGKWTDLTSDLTELHFLPRILTKERVRYASGRGPSWNFMTKHSGAAHHTGLFAVDNVNVGDVMKKAKMTWRHSTTNWAYDELEPEFNDRPEAIIDLVKGRQTDAKISLAHLLEDTWWGDVPEPTDEKTPHGLFYWIVPWKTGTTTPEAGGFFGTNPVSAAGTEYTSGAAGLSSTDYPRWANFAGKYTDVSQTDLIALMRKAMAFTNFINPVPMPNYNRGADRFEIFCNWDIIEKLKIVLRQQNEQLGGDLDPFRTVRVQGSPRVYVPYLNADPRNPVIGINWATIYPYFLRGEYLRNSGVLPAPNQHRVKNVHIDLTWETGCHDRRRNWILTTSSATNTPT